MKKKVLIIAASLKIGGAEKVARDLALHTNPDQFEFHYIVFGDSIGAYESQLTQMGCLIFHFPEPSKNYPKYFESLIRLIEKHKYYIVHAHNMFNCGWAMWIGKRMGIPVRIAHSHSALANGGGFVKYIYEKLMRFLILTCSTDLVACGIKAGHRLFGEKTFDQRGTLILNGIDVGAFVYNTEKRNTVRKQLNIEDRFVLGHTGHLVDVKNQVFLLELMPQIIQRRPDAILLLLGEGADRPMLEQKILDMHLENYVIMTGNVTNVADYLSAMDVFVFPSLYEGLPLSVLEVQANGLPCVISDGVPEDVFLTDLIHPLSLSDSKQKWADTIFSVQRGNAISYNRQLQNSDYTVQAAMEKIYRIYEKGTSND